MPSPPRKTTGSRKYAAGSPASKSRKQPYKVQLKLQPGLASGQKKAIINKASAVTAGQVRPLFKDSGDDELDTYYMIDVPGAARARKAITQLKGTKGIEVISMPKTRRAKASVG